MMLAKDRLAASRAAAQTRAAPGSRADKVSLLGAGVTHRSMLASAAAAWWVWALAILLACLAVVGLAKRRTVYVLLKGDQAEDSQKHLAARGGGKGRGGNKGASKAAELV